MTQPPQSLPAEPEADTAVSEPTSEMPVESVNDADVVEAQPDGEGARRRARRERTERRAGQARARAIEQARRAAKRRITPSDDASTAEPIRRGTVRGLKLLLVGLALTLLTAGLVVVLYFTPTMSVRRIVVVGTGAVTQDEVVDAARVRLGTPLLQINTHQVADRVAEIRRVASARVQRQYPSALRITIVERVPVVVKDFPDGPHLYDRDGVDFATAPPPPALPYIDVDSPGPTDPATKAALAVLTALSPDVAGQVARIAAPTVASISVALSDGRQVIWGTAERIPEKAEKLAALLTQPGRIYDVSSPDLPTVK